MQADFSGGPGVIYNDRLIAAFAIDTKYMSFFRMCTLSRQEKKPILLFLVENPCDDTQIDFLITNLLEKDPRLANMVIESYNLIFMQKSQFYKNLNVSDNYF